MNAINIPAHDSGQRHGGKSARTRNRRGFALVVTISLMVLLSVLAVGLLSLSTIQLRSGSNSKDLATARGNARLALMMAIGQLQKQAGDDRRVTVAADQLSNDSGGAETSAVANRGHWTGVYKSWADGLETRPEPEFVGWLVSGEKSLTRSLDFATSSGASEELVELVGEGTLGQGTNGNVEAPLMSVTASDGETTGKLAWWTGDQGIKATFALPEPQLGSEELVLANLQAAGKSGIEVLSDGNSQPFADADMDDARVSAIHGIRQASFFASEVNQQQPLFHDLAGYSTGLLTDVVKGGFRKDLSMELERPSVADFPLDGSHSRDRPDPRLYTLDDGEEVGVNLQELWVHYNLHKELTSGSVQYTTGGSIPSGVKYLTLPANPATAMTDPVGSHKLPAIVSYQSILSFETQRVSINSETKFRMRMVIDPVLQFWNPFDVPLVLPTACNYAIKYWVLPYDVFISVNRGPELRCPIISSLSNNTTSRTADYNFLSIKAGSTQQLVLKPGEVIKVSQGSVKSNLGGNYIGHNLEGESGFNFGAGVSLTMKTAVGATVDLNANDSISYELRPNELTSGAATNSGNSLAGGNAHSGHFALTMHGNHLSTTRDTSLSTGGVYIDRRFNGRRPTFRSSNSGKPDNERLYATDFPDVFKSFSGASQTRTFRANELEGVKAPFMLFSFNAKTEESSDLGTKTLSRFNPSCHVHDFYDLSQAERDIMPFEVDVQALTSWRNNKIETSPSGQGYFGGGLNAEFGTPFLVTNSVPREPLISLAALQNALANGFTDSKLGRNRQALLPEVNHAIGNSFAPSAMPPDQVRWQLDSKLTAQRPLADHSYLANLALWDSWFFSSIAPTEELGQREVADRFLEDGSGLRNTRYGVDRSGRTKDELLDELFSRSDPTNAATDLMGSLIRVKGMFNVNSTSVEAWKAMLWSLGGQAVVERDENGGTQIREGVNEEAPSAALLTARAENGADATGPNSYWDGGRRLDEVEIEELANEMVNEVRRRGPFLSLADFVNRRVGSDREFAASGALQSAIDRTDINAEYLFGNRSVAEGTASRFAFPEAEEGAKSQGIAGILDQADVLTPIAPVLSARSDSFIIRGYGEATDVTGKVTARAWCEAVVERGSQYTDRTDLPEMRFSELSSEVNERFGRNFRIVSFKWMKPKEI